MKKERNTYKFFFAALLVTAFIWIFREQDSSEISKAEIQEQEYFDDLDSIQIRNASFYPGD